MVPDSNMVLEYPGTRKSPIEVPQRYSGTRAFHFRYWNYNNNNHGDITVIWIEINIQKIMKASARHIQIPVSTSIGGIWWEDRGNANDQRNLELLYAWWVPPPPLEAQPRR